MKHILKNSSGRAIPGEVVAVMGPSGSSKTTLLNLLSQRSKLSLGGKFTGEIVANNR